jgi:PEP-CTERM motif
MLRSHAISAVVAKLLLGFLQNFVGFANFGTRRATEMKRRIVVLLMGIVISGWAAQAQAAPIVFTGTSGTLAAEASFDITAAGLLEVTLTNTSLVDVLIPTQVLTALFFDITGVGALTPLSALLGGGDTVFFDSQPAGGIVGGEWAYGSGLAAPGGATEGISSAGFGLFGGSNFAGPDLDNPLAINGLNYGITSAGDSSATGNAQVTGNVPLIQNSVVFTLGGLPAGFSLIGHIENVSFQYGTALNEPNIDVPEPASLSLLGLGLVAAFGYRRKRVPSVA